MPAFAIGMAVSGMAAQNIGANLWNRVDRITRVGIIVNMALTGRSGVAMLIFDGPLLRLFLPHSEAAVDIAQHINLLAGWRFVIQGVTLVLSSIFRANGAGVAPLMILCLAHGPGRLGTAIGLTPWLAADTIWWSFPIGTLISLILSGLYYRQGHWRRHAMIARHGTSAMTTEF